ncbi:MAG: adventurous gliding motility protein CglE [Pseudomonadota bacterium]|nr:adventurous gliding motility protein CglE [Pseudomonadota bacterium]
MMVLALSASLLSSPLFVSAAYAQDEEEEDFLEEGSDSKKKKSKSSGGGVEDAGAIREINRGFYAKASAGVNSYLLNFSRSVNAGTNVTLAIGQDFVDTEKQSMAWEVGIGQGVHNGAAWYEQAAYGCYTLGTGSEPCTEGDLRTYTLQANYEISFYPVRRIGIGARVGAGVLYSPLLIEPNAYIEDVVDEFGADPGLHNSPKPIVFAGPTFEYYTKLSHFSIGVDVDIVYGIGWDLGLNGTGSLKYTF